MLLKRAETSVVLIVFKDPLLFHVCTLNVNVSYCLLYMHQVPGDCYLYTRRTLMFLTVCSIYIRYQETVICILDERQCFLLFALYTSGTRRLLFVYQTNTNVSYCLLYIHQVPGDCYLYTRRMLMFLTVCSICIRYQETVICILDERQCFLLFALYASGTRRLLFVYQTNKAKHYIYIPLWYSKFKIAG